MEEPESESKKRVEGTLCTRWECEERAQGDTRCEELLRVRVCFVYGTTKDPDCGREGSSMFTIGVTPPIQTTLHLIHKR